MKLVVYQPSPVIGNDFTETVTVNTDNATLWQESYKGQRAGDGNSLSFDFRLFPDGLTLWVEALQSQSLRDIHISLTYHGITDVVTATGVWASVTAVEAASKPAADVSAEFPDMDAGLAAVVTSYGGTGVRSPDPTSGIFNVIVVQFTIYPSRVQPDGTVAGTWEQDGVNFDVARQMAGMTWVQQDLGDPWTGASLVTGLSPQYPVTEEQANDDGTNFDESATVVPSTGHFYVEDAPGLKTVQDCGLSGLTEMLNFQEFVRVSIDATRPSGNGVSGSRASDYYPWHSFVNLADDGTGNWMRKDAGAFDNEIGGGNPGIPNQR